MKSIQAVVEIFTAQKSVLRTRVYVILNAICDEIENICNFSLDAVDQHLDSNNSHIQRKNADSKKFVELSSYIGNSFPTVN